MVGKLCAAIVSEDPEEMIKSAKSALEEGADLVEFRLDYLRKPMDPERLREFSDKCIITIRQKDQGGVFEGTETDRLELLKKFSKINPLYLDIELNAARKNPEIVKELVKNCKNVIISWHNFESTPPLEDLVEMYKEAVGMGGIAKLITTAKLVQDNFTVMTLYREVNAKGDLVSFAMGETGTLTRVLCLYEGSPFSFVSFGGKPSAPSQIPLQIMRRLIASAGSVYGAGRDLRKVT